MGIYLGIGTAAMIVLAVLRRKKIGIPLWKSVVSMLLLTVSGVIGVYTLFYIENGWWGGLSFYGAVLFVPIIMIPAAALVPYKKLMDLCAPGICAMLAVMKLSCIKYECCYGRVLFGDFVFPSQIAELVNALLVLAILLIIEKKSKGFGRLYPAFLMLYGATRFILNSFRGDLVPFVWKLPAGHFWSLCSIVLGAGALIVLKLLEKGADRHEKV